MKYALQLNFKVPNNETEYEALITGLDIAKELRAEELKVFTGSPNIR